MVKNLLVIASYPRKGQVHGSGTVGVASYTKNTLLSILDCAKKKHRNINIIILAEKFKEKDERYQESGLEVRRIWKRNHPLLFLSLIRGIIQFWPIKKVLVEFEVSMFGNWANLVLFPFFLFLLKILGKEIIFVSHQAVDDINELSGHVDIDKESTKADLINLLIYIFYELVFLPVSKIIVFEDDLKEKLKKYTVKEKIVVIPHGVDIFKKNMEKEIARKKLGINNNEFAILYFGFIAWYKGTDWIVGKIQNAKFKMQNKKIKLIIAGGPNPNHNDKKFYMDYVGSIEDAAKLSNGQVVITGFIEEKDIPVYFQACDLVVLPYRTVMSSSGPLSLALSFGKPFIVSGSMKVLFKTRDMAKIVEKLNIKVSDMIFEMKDGTFERKIDKLLKDRLLLDKISLFSSTLGKIRRFDAIGSLYYKEIFL